MIGPSTTGQSDSFRSSAAPPRMPPPRSIDGPATVVKSLGSLTHRAPGNSSFVEIDSDLQRRLFPSDVPPGEDQAPLDVSGSRLEHFRLEEMIGRGGMGAVFRACDERLDRVVALKVLSPGFSRDPATVERFHNEAKAAARLDHENVARVFYSGEDRGMNFIAFEFVTGTNLRDLIRENGRLAPEEAVNYTLQIAAALRHTSAAGVVHRDIKPSNIIVTPSGRAKLVDLGLARKESTESAPDLTVAGTTLGTFDYISPEQAKDPRNVDVRSDIYSLGCTLYHMLTGEPPYPNGTFLQKLLDRQDKTPPDPALKAPRVTPSLSALVRKMMAATPRMRHASADELLNDVMLIAGELGLRGVHPEGLVWAHVSRLYHSRFLERNLGWIVTAAILALVVFAVDRFSRIGGEPSQALSAGAVEPSGAAGAAAGSRTGPAKARASKVRGGAAASAAKPNLGPNPNDVNRSTLITLSQQLDPKFLKALKAGTGVLGSVGVTTTTGAAGANDAVVRRSLPPDNDPAAGATNGSTNTATGNAVEKPAAISIVGRGPFPSLEAACAAACAAATSGQVIVLNFNGIRRNADGKPVVDRPVRIDNKKSITIRAADGMHPVLYFSGEDVVSSGAQTRMVTVANGTLNVFGVGFRMKVNDQIDADNDARWSLFALRGSDSIALKYVNVAVDNPRGRSAAIFEIASKSGFDPRRMKMMKKSESMAADRFDITVAEDSFLRGDCDVLAVACSRPGLLNVEKTAIVAGESLLSVVADGMGEAAAEKTDRVELKLVHVTCVTGNGLISMATGETPGLVLPVHVRSQDNLFAATGKRPFVQISGAGRLRDLQRLLKWKGEKNFYRGYASMWRTVPDGAAVQVDSLSFEHWKNHWGSNEVDPGDQGVVWKHDDWLAKTTGEVVPADLELGASSDSPAARGVTDTTDGMTVGADMSAIAKRMGIKTKPVSEP
jgi:eukaryotic-like serine/threonine-protein kinase